MFPKTLYKSFQRQKYAKEFCSGKIRFSTLKYYKNIEDDIRADKTEGFGSVKRDGETILVDMNNKSIKSKPGIENIYVSGGEEDRFIVTVR